MKPNAEDCTRLAMTKVNVMVEWASRQLAVRISSVLPVRPALRHTGRL